MEEPVATIIAASISAGGVFITVLVTIGIYLFTRRYDYHRLYAETVSQSRNKWLNEMRQYLSEMLAEAENSFKEPTKSISNSYYKSRNEIILRLNKKEKLHIDLENHIKNLDRIIGNDEDEFHIIKENIIETARSILKEEWEKVKGESKGKEARQSKRSKKSHKTKSDNDQWDSSGITPSE